MNQHIAATQWIVAMLIGFYIWWPIGLMILGAITLVALGQQITGHRPSPPPALPQRLPRLPPPVQIIEPPMKTIGHVKYKRIK